MGNRKISELAAPGPLTGAEKLPVVQDGETVQPPLSAISDYVVSTIWTVGASADDDFTNKPNGALVEGALSDSGHPYTLFESPVGSGFTVQSGTLTHVPTGAGVSAAYASLQLSDDAVSIYADFIIPSGAGTPEAIVLILGSGAMESPFPPQALHFVLTTTTYSIETLDNPFATPQVLGGSLPSTLANDVVHRVRVDLRGDKATMLIPGLSFAVETPAAAKILSQQGRWATLELFTNSAPTAKALRILRWGAVTDATDDFSGVKSYDTNQIVAQAVNRWAPADNWTAFTPVLGQTGSTATLWTLGSSAVTAKFSKLGRLVNFNIRIDWAADAVFGTGSPTLTLPATGRSGGRPTFEFVMLDTSASSFYRGSALSSELTMGFWVPNGSNGLQQTLTNAAPIAMANGDRWYINGTYEAA